MDTERGSCRIFLSSELVIFFYRPLDIEHSRILSLVWGQPHLLFQRNKYIHLGQAIKSEKFGGPLKKKGTTGSFDGPYWQIFWLDLETTDKLEFTNWFEGNPTFDPDE